MLRLHRFLMPAVLIMTVCGCSRTPARPELQHPPVSDLSCPAEPGVPVALDEISALRFDESVRVAGQLCRDALARVCAWHVDLGLKAACGAVK